MAGEHKYWAFYALFAQHTTQFAAINIWQSNVQDNQIVYLLFYFFQSIGSVTTLEDSEVLGHNQLFA